MWRGSQHLLGEMIIKPNGKLPSHRRLRKKNGRNPRKKERLGVPRRRELIFIVVYLLGSEQLLPKKI
jgi:hypothetical protein